MLPHTTHKSALHHFLCSLPQQTPHPSSALGWQRCLCAVRLRSTSHAQLAEHGASAFRWARCRVARASIAHARIIHMSHMPAQHMQESYTCLHALECKHSSLCRIP
eukprot:1161350-Pelagomonas_calceolata.AAC.17